MTFNREELPKKRQAEMNRAEYASWKKRGLNNFGFFPVFQPFKETFLLKNLSGNALRLYLYLGLMSGNETGETWVTIDTMAAYFNKSKRTISGWIKELEQAELIERMQLKPDGPAHTFLKPYGYEHMNDKNSLQKGKLSSSKQSSNDDILF
ncbi:helix-turn-helix domain-containing protein [Ferdinandcohnia sp. SAFN-114]|uniref:helix-turn-helix domain-containing protein n=1 Tax=Ferdinandcohnia sp. SAFN-114 TaxID=3387275 RepID=UPI003F803140